MNLRVSNYLVIPLMALLVGLSGCSSRGLPETPERAKLTDAVVHRLLSDANISEPEPKSEFEMRQYIQTAIQKRRNDIGVSLPDAYWSQVEELTYQYSRGEQSFQQYAISDYKRKFKAKLARASDEQLDILIHSENMKDTIEFKQFFKNFDRDMFVLNLAMNSYTARSRYVEQMRELDSKYDVCSKVSTCWK
ncbi:hypothetical protein K5Q02_20900 [Pseudomonas sp. MM211]|uniref:hypothetical protein n=1 Tax=Pseudomonas sp. MM211 TaxID=2866808 RepID=UPI001CED35DB|nr:hypothetical protein [Pseudomonas sp. MM211]UCJ16237.1 hypothetical protein K5Q02_20900 [Pseudomonas sp. MM211]